MDVPSGRTSTLSSSKDQDVWHAAFPNPSSNPQVISAAQLKILLSHHYIQDGVRKASSTGTFLRHETHSSSKEGSFGHEKPSTDPSFLVVDVRRTDFEDGFILGAINLPAHSFYQTLPSLIPILSRYSLVIFHCNNCKKGGRGERVAGWFQDELNRQHITSCKSAILEGGIKGWLKEYGDTELTVKI